MFNLDWGRGGGGFDVYANYLSIYLLVVLVRRPSRRWQDDITEKEGTTWIRKATDRRRWKALMEGYILQWMDKA